MMHRPLVRAALGSALLALACGPALAQGDFPTRAITIVVPFPAGGTADLLCRYAGEKAAAALGQQVVVENRPGGAGGRIGMEQVMRATPDGYTLLCSTQLSYSITHLVFTKAAFDPRPLEPISVLATYPLIILTKKSLPVNTMAEFIAYAKANDGKVNYGNQGVANTGHLLGELMMMKAGFKMTAVFYRGSAPAINDLLAGTIDMVPDYLLANKGNIDAGNLKFIAVAQEQRLKDYPNVPTVAETLPGRDVDHLDGGVSATRNAEGDHAEALRRDRQGLQGSRHAGAHPQARSQPAWQHAGRDAEDHPGKPGYVGPGGPGPKDFGRLAPIAPSNRCHARA